ncbi:hypothetical protein Tco_1041678 [Tanacetum coccineum]|uniref:Uncharacterized protein n=1 Tax=Tanacetum coccineum TaxID=301880 RepID=A0ABQ5GGU5_9ASTR
MAALSYKDDHNKIAYLGRERGCEDFTDILSYLDHSPLRYALTHAPPVVFDSLVKQFWATAVVRPNAAGSHDLVATIDGREVVVTESLIRTQLQFDDANGIFDMPINDILEGMGVIGYPTDGTLTFLKHHLSPQWRFLVHTIMHCLSPKAGSWNQFPSSIATALICLSTGRAIPLTPPMLAIAAAGNDAANEDDAAANEAAGSAAEAHLVPYSPPVSPVREPTPERQPASERPPSPSPTPPAQTFSFAEPLVFGPEPRPAGPGNYLEPEDIDNIISMEDDTTHGGFHMESPVGPDDAPTPTADAAGRAEDPVLLTSLSAKLDRCMGQIGEMGKRWTDNTVMGMHLAAEGDVDIQDDVDLDGLSRMASAALGHDQPVVPSEDVEEREEEEVPLRRKMSAFRRARTEFSTPAFEQFQANLSAGGLPQTVVSESAGPSVAADKGKAPMPDLDIPAEFLALDAPSMCNGSKKTGARKGIRRSHDAYDRNRLVEFDDASCSNTALARALLGADVFEEKTLLSAMTLLLRKRRSEPWQIYVIEHSRGSFATTVPADDSDFAGGGSSKPAGSATPMAGSAIFDTAGGTLGATVTDSTIITIAALDPAGSHHTIGVSPFADSAAGGINEFFLDSDERRPRLVCSRVVDNLPDDEIVDPQVKVETIFASVSSPPRSRRKHIGVRGDGVLWDKPVKDFFSSESESDDDIENYIPPLPYGEFKDWEMVSCPPGNNYIHVYYQQNRRRKYFTYLKELLPHVYREDLLLLRRRMNRYFRLNPEVDVGLDLWRDVNMLCQSLHSVDVEDFWRTQDEWIVSSWKLYPKSSVHVLDLTNGKTVYMFVDKFYPIRATLLERMLRHRLTVPPSYCRDVVVSGSVIQTVQTGLRQSYECLASVPFACTSRQMVFSSPWLTAKKESGSPLQTALVCFSNPLIALASPEQTATGKDVSNPLYGCDGLPKIVRVFQFTFDSCSEKLDWFLLHQGVCFTKVSTSPRVSSYLVKASQIYLCCCKDWMLLFFDVATSFDSAVQRVHAVSIDAADLDVASMVSAACIVAAEYIVSAGIYDATGLFVLAVFIYTCCFLCFCCYSILLLREDLSRNLELTESTPSLGEDCWELLKTTKYIESADLIYRRDYCMQKL